MASLPMDVLLHIFEFIDSPKDLLAFALSARVYYNAIVPRYIDYRHIACNQALDTVWKHLLETPDVCSYVRYLDLMEARVRTAIPRMCKTALTTPRVGPVADETFLQAVSKMNNLKIFKFHIRAPSEGMICTLSQAIEKAGCQLEEIEMHFDSPVKIDQYIQENKGPSDAKEFSLFYDCMPSLRKYIIKSHYPSNGDIFFQMILNAPNLTHMNITFSTPYTFLSSYWPNLEHLVVHSNDNLQRNNTEAEHLSHLQTFFSRHSKLVTLSAANVLIPGWAIESDEFLPRLKSLAIPVYPNNRHNPTITANIATSLTHLEMTPQLYSSLKQHNVTLPLLETCRYWNANPEAPIQDLVEVMPNIRKLYFVFGSVQVDNNRGDTNTTNNPFMFNSFPVMRWITADEIMERAPFFSGFKHLCVFMGPFDQIDISANAEDHPLFRLLYEFPSLMYTRAKFGNNLHFLRLHRNPITKIMKYERECNCPRECDMVSWGDFYERSPSVVRRY